MLCHLYDQSICSVLERCLVFSKTVFETNLEQATEIRNSLVTNLVEQCLEGKPSFDVLKELPEEVLEHLLHDDDVQ
jgi:hypothetical protein